jgi:DNA-binding NtrC family response regulator
VQHAVVMCRGESVEPRDLPAGIRDPAPSPAPSIAVPAESPAEAVPGRMTMKEAEKQLIIHALQQAGGNRTAAAARLGISRRTLHRKLHEFHLEGF